MKHIKIIILGLNLVLLIGQLVVSHFRATAGDQVAAAESQIRQISDANRQLQTQINAASSLSAIDRQAREDHFQPITISTFTPPPVAKAP